MDQNQSAESLNTSYEKSGMPPGTMIHVGEMHEQECRISVIDYQASRIDMREIDAIEDLTQYLNPDTKTWVNIEGLQAVDVIADIGRLFNIHPLVLEDILNTNQRSKLNEYDDYIYFVIKNLIFNQEEEFDISQEQISILLLDNIVFTFKEKSDELFAPIVKRLKVKNGRLRNRSVDYLTYVIIDTIVDQYFILEDKIDEYIEPLEYELLTDPSQDILTTLLNIKRELIYIKRNVVPIREMLTEIQGIESLLIQNETLHYFTDVYDHCQRILETVDVSREVVNSLHDIYLSSLSIQMNQTMKVLTVFASIFIPLTFIAGIYGMNFEYMPELKIRWAYPALWAFMLSVAIILLIYFKRKKWL